MHSDVAITNPLSRDYITNIAHRFYRDVDKSALNHYCRWGGIINFYLKHNVNAIK